MRIPFVGAEYKLATSNQSAQRCVNWYLEIEEKPGTKTPNMLVPAAGTVGKVICGTGPIRGLYPFGGFLYAVSGSGVYRIDGNYNATLLGSITTTSGDVSITGNQSQILIVDGVAGYLVTIASGSVSVITAAGFPNGAKWARFVDGYFLVGGDGSKSFHISAINDGTSWAALDFASTVAYSGPLIAGEVDHRNVWLFGDGWTEVWYDTGNALFPFQRMGNSFLEVGCSAVGSVTKLDNSIFWLGRDSRGDSIVWRTDGLNNARISDFGIERAISSYSRIDDAIAYGWKIGGHQFYVLTFPTADITWVYDVTANAWHEWAWRDPLTGVLHRHRGQCHAFFNRDHVVGDWQTGAIYALSTTTYTDAYVSGGVFVNVPILRLRTTSQQDSENQFVYYQSIEIDVEPALGLNSGQGSDPKLMLRWSDDGGHRWCNTKYLALGKIGQYRNRAKREQLGAARNRVWELSCSDPINIVILGAEARQREGMS